MGRKKQKGRGLSAGSRATQFKPATGDRNENETPDAEQKRTVQVSNCDLLTYHDRCTSAGAGRSQIEGSRAKTKRARQVFDGDDDNDADDDGDDSTTTCMLGG